jgi:hypothetical protein
MLVKMRILILSVLSVLFLSFTTYSQESKNDNKEMNSKEILGVLTEEGLIMDKEAERNIYLKEFIEPIKKKAKEEIKREGELSTENIKNQFANIKSKVKGKNFDQAIYEGYKLLYQIDNTKNTTQYNAVKEYIEMMESAYYHLWKKGKE